MQRTRVLVVDDALLNRKMLLRLLQRDNFVFAEAADGHRAVTLVQDGMNHGNPIDLVLMDYQMPVMDGPTAARKMRDLGFTGVIIGITGNALASDLECFLSRGANKVLTKPVNLNGLEDAFEGIFLFLLSYLLI